jgi:hypothetical protein
MPRRRREPARACLDEQGGPRRRAGPGQAGPHHRRDPSPAGDEVLDAALRIITAHQGKKPSPVIRPPGKNLRRTLYERLALGRVIRCGQARIPASSPPSAGRLKMPATQRRCAAWRPRRWCSRPHRTPEPPRSSHAARAQARAQDRRPPSVRTVETAPASAC